MSTTRGPCPQCDRGPKDTALAITTDERGTVCFCHRCSYVSHDPAAQPLRPAAPTPIAYGTVDWSVTAERIWRRTQPLRGSIGAVYLEHRGCRLPPADSDLRFLPAADGFPPSLCGLITDAVTGRKMSLHFTRLATDGRGKAGTDRDKLLLKGHRKRSGVIRLWPDEAITTGIAIAEGIETALGAAHIFTPVWSMIDCGNLAAFPVLAGIQSLVIFADHDTAGIGAARECARRWRDAGREVLARVPKRPGQDVADLAAWSRARRIA